jgi:pyrophosphatase PpaX
MIGPPLKETFLIASEDPLVIEEMIEYYRKVYVDYEFKYITIYPNTIKMLEILAKRGYNLGIVTTKFEESALPSITYYGLDKYITSFCFLDDIKEHKPHPEPIYYALSKFKNYNKVIMVGDNTGDIQAGFNANCLTCGVDWSIKRELIKEQKPDFWIKDYLELIDIIDTYNKEE